MESQDYRKNLEVYEKSIALTPGVERKGKTMPYTSANGYMFSQINKDGEIGIRLPEKERREFLKKYDTPPFKSYGAVMKDYVLIPKELLDQPEVISSLLLVGFQYVRSLKPK